MLGDAAIERITLWANHVIASEPVAARRLQPHAGRCMQFHFDGWPTLLPALPRLSFRVTPAGLLEWCGSDVGGDPALCVHVAAANPALAAVQALAGTRPRIDVAGDAAFAADLNWLIDNLRWDIEDDLARVVGPAPAHRIARVAGVAAGGMRSAVHALTALAARGAAAMPRRP
jgi:ubiquinone biosynthesis protein UbiJ